MDAATVLLGRDDKEMRAVTTTLDPDTTATDGRADRKVDPRNLGERLEANQALDALAEPLHRAAQRLLPRGRFKDALHGVWLGHPLHPVLTDLPIGMWTSAMLLDLLGGRKAQPAADRLVALGVVAVLPTASSGLADWSELNQPERRTGAVHAVANVAATGLYAASSIARRRGRRATGVALALAGGAAVAAGGFLGGHLSYRRTAGVNQVASAAAPEDWVDVEGDLPDAPDQATCGAIDGTPVAIFMVDGTPQALADHCSHLGGPLHEGDIADGCVRCPWHGSTFHIGDGAVTTGPATATQPAYEIRRTGDRLLARRKPMP